MRKILSIFLLFIFILAINVYAVNYRPMVIKVDTDQVKLNIGSEKGVVNDEEFYIYRAGKYIGKAKILRAEPAYSFAKIISLQHGETVNIGDTLNKELSSISPDTAVSNIQQSANTSSSNSVENNAVKNENNTEVSSPKNKNQVVNFETTLKNNTKSFAFTVKGSINNETSPYTHNLFVKPQIDASDSAPSLQTSTTTNPAATAVLDLLSLAGYVSLYTNSNTAGWFNNNFMFYTTMAGSLYSRYENYRQANKILKVNNKATMEVTYWSDKLIDDYADFYAYKEATKDDTLKTKMSAQIKKDKEIDTYTVFEIRVKNDTKGAVLLSPMNWHVYMIGPTGERYKAEKYDKVLDQAVGQNQAIAGFVYFKKIDFEGKPVTLSLEDVCGVNKTFTW